MQRPVLRCVVIQCHWHEEQVNVVNDVPHPRRGN